MPSIKGQLALFWQRMGVLASTNHCEQLVTHLGTIGSSPLSSSELEVAQHWCVSLKYVLDICVNVIWFVVVSNPVRAFHWQQPCCASE